MTQIGTANDPKNSATKEEVKVVEEKKPEKKLPSSIDVRYYLLGIPVTIVLGMLVQYVYMNFYVIPKMERTLMKPEVRYGNVDRKAWAPLSPSDIFSLKTQNPNSPKFGIGWYERTDSPNNQVKHSVHGIDSFNWEESDGISYGIQTVRDGPLTVSIRWLNNGEGWTTRITVRTEESQVTRKHGLFFYFESDDTIHVGNTVDKVIQGRSKLFENYSISADLWGDELDFHSFSTDKFSESEASSIILNKEEPAAVKGKKSTAVVYMDIPSQFEVEFSFSTDSFEALKAEEFFKEISKRSIDFQKKFDGVFELSKKNMSDHYTRMAKSALSNVLSSKIYLSENIPATGKFNEQFSYGPVDLTVFMASRESREVTLEDQIGSILTLLPYNPEFCLNVLVDWFNLANEEGWIPSSISLDQQPSDFTHTFAPQIFSIWDTFVQDEEFVSQHEGILRALYPRLEKYADILLKYMSTSVPGVFRWNEKASFNLFARETIVKGKGRQVDIQTWMSLVCRTMSDLSGRFGTSAKHNQFQALYSTVKEVNTWRKYFSNEATEEFTDTVITVTKLSDGKTVENEEKAPSKGVHAALPLLFNLTVVPEDYLANIMDAWTSEENLFTPFGICSQKGCVSAGESTDGNVVIPVNFWILKYLQSTASTTGPHQETSHILYSKLRNSLISWMTQNYKKTGMLWESYSPKDGSGTGRRQMNWSSLILRIIAEKF